MAEKTREQRIAEAKERLEDFSKRTLRMYEFVEELLDINKSFDDKCAELKSSNLCKVREYELFDEYYKKMCDDITNKFREENVDLEGLDILQNILYEDDRVDGKAMYLILTCWCLSNVNTYPIEALCLTMEINHKLSV